MAMLSASYTDTNPSRSIICILTLHLRSALRYACVGNVVVNRAVDLSSACFVALCKSAAMKLGYTLVVMLLAGIWAAHGDPSSLSNHAKGQYLL